MANTEPYPTNWNTIHFGIDSEDIADQVFGIFRDQMQMQGALIYIDGDGWQDWKEMPGTGNNDTTTMHVQMAAQTKADAVTCITALRGSGLVLAPRLTGEHGSSGPTIIATHTEDWNNVFYTESTS